MTRCNCPSLLTEPNATNCGAYCANIKCVMRCEILTLIASRCERAVSTILCLHEPYCHAGAGCGDHGQCVNGTCICDPLYFGAACESKLCNDGLGCGDHGECQVNGTCRCEALYDGPACDIQLCNGGAGCGKFGTCVNGTCVCDELFGGDLCDGRLCNGGLGCGLSGTCVDGTCVCDVRHGGAACETVLCNEGLGCGENGKCLGNGTCRCFALWTGADCSTPSPPPQATVSAVWMDGAADAHATDSLKSCRCAGSYGGSCCQLGAQHMVAAPDPAGAGRDRRTHV